MTYRIVDSAKAASGWREGAMAAGVWLTVVGTRLGLIKAFNVEIPVLDQWYDEGATLLLPLVDSGGVPPGNWLAPWGDHVPVFSRLLTVGVFGLTGRWTNAAHLIVNAVLVGLLASWLWWHLTRIAGKTDRRWVWLAVCTAFVLPVNWQGTLATFHSTRYFLVGFSLVALALLTSRVPGSPGWWTGAGFAVAAPFAMSSGVAAAGSLAIVAGLRGVWEQRPLRDWLRRERGVLALTVVAGTAWLALGSIHGKPGPRSAFEFSTVLGTFVKAMAWPFHSGLLVGAILWFPLVASGGLYVSGRSGDGPAQRLVLAMGVWIVLLAGAIAVYRSVPAGPVGDKFGTELVHGLLANWLALMVMIKPEFERRRRGWFRVLAAAWLLMAYIGLAGAASATLRHHLPARRLLHRLQRNAVAEFVATDDLAALRRGSRKAWPLQDADYLGTLLRKPSMRAILPAKAAPALSHKWRSVPPSVFEPGGVPAHLKSRFAADCVGSYGADRGGGSPELIGVFSAPSDAVAILLRVAGSRGGAGLGLRMESLDGKGRRVLVTGRQLVPAWRTLRVELPWRRFRMIAYDHDPDAWIGFSLPRAVGRTAILVEGILETWKWWVALGLALFVAAGYGRVDRAVRRPRGRAHRRA